MFSPAEICQSICLVPTICGSVYSILTVWSAERFFNQSGPAAGELSNKFQPAVTVLKPVRGLEKDLKANLSSICTQDYPEYQVVYSVQDPADPALAILEEIQAEFGSERVSVTISTVQVGANGKVNNHLQQPAQADLQRDALGKHGGQRRLFSVHEPVCGAVHG